MERLSTLKEIAAAVLELLAHRGPLEADELVSRLRDRGLDLGREPDETLDKVLDRDDLGLVVALYDGRRAYLPSLLDDRTFSHRLSPAELAYGYLVLSPDLQPLSLLLEDPTYQRLTDGSAVVNVLPGFDERLIAARGIPVDAFDEDSLLLDPGVLPGLGLVAGDLVGVTVRSTGLEITPAHPRVLPHDFVSALDGAVHEGQQPIDQVVWQLCVDTPGLFTDSALPPLGELFAEAGLAWEGDWVAPPGFDFAGWRLQERVGHVQRLHRLGDDEALAVVVLSTLFGQVERVVEAAGEALAKGHPLEPIFAEDPPHETTRASDELPSAARVQEEQERKLVVRDTLEFLADPAVAEAFLVETIGAGREGAVTLGVFAESLEDQAPRAARPALRWLRGKACERMGDIAAAVAAFESASALDPTWPPAVLDLARVASDRGDAEKGLSLLRRAGAGRANALVVLLEHFRPMPRPGLRRNQPCWCGSGRKYKLCHANREALPLEERASWLYQKAGMYLADGPWREDLIEVGAIRAQHWTQPEALWAAVQDPLVTDSVLFEGGAFAAFLEERGSLLPEDERLLAEQWLLTDRSVFEVESVQPGSGFVARDLRTGDLLDVQERAGSRSLKQGMLLCARLVPAGDTVQCFGGLEVVSMGERDMLLALLDADPEPEDLVALLSAKFAPPTLQNTEGEDLVLCEATLRSPDSAALVAALDRELGRDGEDPRWHEHVTTQGMERIRATITLVGDEVRVETNSEARLERVLDTLRALQPSLELVTEDRQPAEDVAEVMSRAPGGAPAGAQLDPADPAIAAALEEFTRRYEENWLNEQIPALAGATPREAAVDPTRRSDLVRLLETFPTGGPGQMSTERLRAALGL